MLRFLEAGLVAASRQFMAVVVITFTVLTVRSHFVPVPPALAEDTGSCAVWTWLSERLTWSYLIIAFGLSLTKDSAVSATAERMQCAARQLSPKHGSRPLAAQFTIAALLVATFALQTPPDLFIGIGGYFGYACIERIFWPAALSVSVAALGASAHAAIRSLD